MKGVLTKDNIIYADGFPANIDLTKTVVVQIPYKTTQGVVIYTCKIDGNQSRCYLPTELNNKYKEGLYIFN